MIAANPTAASRCRTLTPASHGPEHRNPKDATPEQVAASTWIEPGSGRAYPTSYAAYRRAREAEEKSPPRHRTLGPEVDRHIWRRWWAAAAPDVEVVLTVSPCAPPRVRRIVAEVLRGIRRGQSAGFAIRRVSKRFGLRRRRALACIAACLGFEVRARQEAISPVLAAAALLASMT